VEESVAAHIARTGKSQAQVAREIERSPQALNNMLNRHDDLHVIVGPTDNILYMGYYEEYYSHGD